MTQLLKKALTLCLLMLGTLTLQATTGDGDKLSKSLQKECKKAVKQLKREGWTVNGVSQSVEQAMEAHFLRLEAAGASSMVIEGNGKGKSVNIAVKRAMSNASSQLATMRESTVEGKTEVKVANEASSASETSTHTSLDASYVSSTSQTLKKFTPTVVFYRKTGDDSYEARALYVVDEAE